MSQTKRKLPDFLPLPKGASDWEVRTARVLQDYFRNLSQQVNDLATGRRAAMFNEDSVAPTSGLFAVGDFVPRKDAVEEGTTGTKYIHVGWRCVSEGSASAASFVTVRELTGN